MRQRLLLVLLAAVFALAPPAAAQGFEGIIRQRTIMVDSDALNEILFTLEDEEMDEEEFDEEDELDEEEYEEYEQRYMRAMMDRILELSVDELLSMARSGLDIEVEETTMSVKGAKIRADVGAFGYFIMDADEETLWMVSPERSAFVKWTQVDMEAAERRVQEMMASMGLDPEDMERGGPEPSGPATLEPLSRTARINGFDATGYRAESRNAVTVGWVAKDVHGVGRTFKALTESMEALSGDDEDASGSMETLFWEKGLPVRTQAVSTVFGSLSHYEVTDFLSIEPTSVSDELFKIPAGFREVSMEDLFR